ncbi:MAG: oligosaccharide flippase family protein [Butyrivibrio sp.]|jgi:O-antigen/teichoic acid export membrane protein|nr:oligosaccharide flippase family protein [Butyrivibrio sp.]
MNRKKSLLKNTLILSLGQIFPQLVGVITLPIYTGMLTSAEYGRYDLINVIVYILNVVVILQIHQAVFRYLLDVRGTEKEKEYITNTIVFELGPSLVSSVLFGVCFRELSVSVRILLGVYLFLNIQNSVVGQISRGLGKNRQYAFGAIINSGLNMILVVILMAGAKLGFKGLFISLDIAFLSAVIYQIIACKQLERIDFKYLSKDVLKVMLNYSWPMIPNTLSIWIVNSCDKFIIRFFLGIEMNGVYAVAQKIPNVFSIAYSTFNMAWQESASISVKDKDADLYYDSIFKALFDFLTGCMLILISATPILYGILIRGSYEAAYDQMSLLYIGVFLSSISSFFGSIYIAQKATKEVGISSLIGAVINCIVNIAMIHWAGLYAASVSTIVSYLILTLYRGTDVKKRGFADIKYNIKHILLCLSLISISSIICYQRVLYLNIFNFLYGALGFIMLNKNMIKGIVITVEHKIKGRSAHNE